MPTGVTRQVCARRGHGSTRISTLSTTAAPPDVWRGFVLYSDMDFSKLDGLIPAVVQDHASGEVLMVGFMNQEAWDVTRRTGYVTFFSRTRNKLWTKGETSGNRLAVRDVLIDCDEDTVLVKAERLGDGNVCHTGERTCFFQRAEGVTMP
jgi:phosphoribosyl-AMP cyclohydrolase